MKDIFDYLGEDLDGADKELIDRAVATLYGNIIPACESGVFGKNRGIMPSPSTYKGVWNWDSAFHLLAMSYLDKDIAQEQAKIMFENMREDGMLPDVIFNNGKKVFKFTKPPVYASCIAGGDRISPDTDFLNYCYPYLVRNLKWWEECRYDGVLFGYKVNGMESGWDDSVRFVFPNRIKNIYPVDCNCYMADFYKSMSYIAQKLGKKEDAEYYDKKSDVLGQKIEDMLFDKERGFYVDYDKKRKRFIKQKSIAGFMPLYIGTATAEHAESCIEYARQKEGFYPLMPTLSYDDKSFKANGYWNGPCWLNTAYFALKGIYEYGAEELAFDICQNILDMASKEKQSIFERYDSKTGKGLGARDFGWSASFIILLEKLKYNK